MDVKPALISVSMLWCFFISIGFLCEGTDSMAVVVLGSQEAISVSSFPISAAYTDLGRGGNSLRRKSQMFQAQPPPPSPPTYQNQQRDMSFVYPGTWREKLNV